LSERSEEQKKEIQHLMQRLSGNPFPDDTHSKPDRENNGLRMAEDRGRLVVRETPQFVSHKKDQWHWSEQEAKQEHSARRMLWAEGSEKESRSCALAPKTMSVFSLPVDHKQWEIASRDTTLLADREELSFRLAAERRSARAVQRKPLGGCATGRRFNRTEGREEFWIEGEYRKDGPQPEWRFPHGYDSSRGASSKLDTAEKTWSDGLLLEDMVRAKHGADVGRIAQELKSLSAGGQ
jgi:hypothetical protein